MKRQPVIGIGGSSEQNCGSISTGSLRAEDVDFIDMAGDETLASLDSAREKRIFA